MSLLEQLNEDLKTAMKSKDTLTLNVVRMVKSAVQMEKIKKKKQDLTDEEVIDIVNKQIKMRKDAITEFAKASREDLINQNEQEIAVLNKYMPEQLSDDEVKAIIDEAFTILNPTSMKDMGKIMKEITPKLKGKTDMGKVNAMIKEKLN